MAVSFWTDCWVGKVHGRPEKLAINTSCTEQGSEREVRGYSATTVCNCFCSVAGQKVCFVNVILPYLFWTRAKEFHIGKSTVISDNVEYNMLVVYFYLLFEFILYLT